ncbi:hypothetical protein [Lysobacter sp. H23M47]|uniref:hypothetical protein n=1 Tax=Lysobacter sp. H23M47 TaxID=2781024 RepID=UPI00187F74B7|nr:hypothetical protein [Lysobacter sp. H23M47]QOW24906.1 hypothetical protein INQ43_02215 [Lysobacter sp. H23M47]
MTVSTIGSAIVAASIVIGGGCASEKGSAVPAKAAAEARRQAPAVTFPGVVIHTDAGEFSFQPASCSVGEEDGAQVFTVHGPGKGPDGKPVYVDIDGADQGPMGDTDMRIHVGVDAQFKHGDPAWISNSAVSHGFDVPASVASVEGDVVVLSGVVFSADGDSRLDVEGPVRIDCSR